MVIIYCEYIFIPFTFFIVHVCRIYVYICVWSFMYYDRITSVMRLRFAKNQIKAFFRIFFAEDPLNPLWCFSDVFKETTNFKLLLLHAPYFYWPICMESALQYRDSQLDHHLTAASLILNARTQSTSHDQESLVNIKS